MRLARLGSFALLVIVAPGLATACSSSSDASGPEEVDQWRLVFADEFNGAANQSPDPSKWTFDVGTGVNGWGNGQFEYNSDRPDNVSMDGSGNLAIVAREEAFEGQNYTSGRIKTQGLFDQAYGRFEARIKLPIGQGIWPAFWMLGADIDLVGWPQTGEIDIMEYDGSEPSILHGSLHGPGYSGGTPVTTEFETGIRLDLDFHVYRVDWDPDRITWYFDEQEYFTVRRSQVPGEWVFDDPFFLLLNVAVGGAFVGFNIDANFPQTMLVDYVRVYERTP